MDFDKLSVAFAKFPFYVCNPRSSPHPNMLSVTYDNFSCKRGVHSLKINGAYSSLKKPESMSPELKFILQTGAENQSWEIGGKKEGKMNKAEQSKVEFNGMW